MKIHESMNVLMYKSTIHSLLSVLLLLIGMVAYGQSPTLQVHDLVMLKNTTLAFPFHNYHSFNGSQKLRPDNTKPSYHWSVFSNGHKRIGVAGGNDTLFYTPPQGFIGRDTVHILRWIQGANYFPQAAYFVLHIVVKPSSITAMPDYVATPMNQSLMIDVLANDFGNGTNQVIAEVTNKNRGEAVLINGGTQVQFTPTPGFVGLSHFNYTICDDQGACHMATVNICVTDPNPPAYDSIAVQTKENDPQLVLMALDSNYSVTLAPQNGILVDTGAVLVYQPNAGYHGMDKVIFTDAGNNRTRVFQIEMIGPAPYRGIYLRDDVVHTVVDEPIYEIRLLDNDIAGNLMNNVGRVNGATTALGGTTIYRPNIGLGVYEYHPPAGVSGIDHFRYKATVPGGGLTDTATCYIVLDNRMPALPLFQLSVPVETPLVLGNNLPFASYDYRIVTPPNPAKATLTYFPGQDSYTSQYGQTVEGYNMLVYEPLEGASGGDGFEVEYCVPDLGGQCQLVKVEMDIYQPTNAQSDTLCAGTACVWPGDTNKDGRVDINDLLPIGLAMGEVGPVRANIGNNEWYAQYGNDWNSLNIDGLPFDVKQVDSDGNGIVSAMDTTAIGQYYGRYNNIVPAAAAPISDLPFYPGAFPNNPPPQPGDVILVPLHLGDAQHPAFDAYGLTFSLDYDPLFFESVKVFWNHDAWMNYNSPVLSMSHYPISGKLDAGYTRTNGVPATGLGIIGVLEFIVIDDVAGIRPSDEASTVTIQGNLMNTGGQVNSLQAHTLSFSLGLNEDGKNHSKTQPSDNLLVFPNPARGQVNIHLNGGKDHLMERIALYNAVGAQVYDSGATLAKRTQLDVAGLPTGVYLVRVWSQGEVMTKKIVVEGN